MVYLNKCLWCRSPIERKLITVLNPLDIECPTCGKYFVSGADVPNNDVDFFDVPETERYLVAAWIRQKSRSSVRAIYIGKEDAKTIAANSPRLEPWDKALKLLLVIGELSRKPGNVVDYHAVTFADATAQDQEELDAYLSWLDDAGLIKYHSTTSFYATANGWRELAARRQQHRAMGTRAFVAMWFDTSMDDAFNLGIVPACKEAGFDAYRVKEDKHGERIDARIIAGIRESRFLIADVTGERTAVYYEAGFADGLGKQVIWTCRKDHMEKMSFDTRQFTHILWETPEDLKAQLVPMIKARIV